MVRIGLLVRLSAKPGKESEVADFLAGALPLANQEATTPVWFALRLGPSTFGIFDAFADEAGRSAHLAGPIAAALMANAHYRQTARLFAFDGQAARLRYGCTWINTHFMLTNEMPHGGLKQSGYGKDMSAYALEDYTVVRHVMVKHG